MEHTKLLVVLSSLGKNVRVFVVVDKKKPHLDQLVSCYHQYNKYHLYKPNLHEAVGWRRVWILEFNRDNKLSVISKSITLLSVKNQTV